VARFRVRPPKFPSAPGEYVVIVTIGPGNTPWNVIRGFARRGGSYVSVARAGDDLKNRRLAVDRMESFGPEEVRFLVSGWLAQTPGLWGLRFPGGTGFGRGLISAVHFQDRCILPEIKTPTRPRPAEQLQKQIDELKGRLGLDKAEIGTRRHGGFLCGISRHHAMAF
jgi:hypothetical protein